MVKFWIQSKPMHRQALKKLSYILLKLLNEGKKAVKNPAFAPLYKSDYSSLYSHLFGQSRVLLRRRGYFKPWMGFFALRAFRTEAGEVVEAEDPSDVIV